MPDQAGESDESAVTAMSLAEEVKYLESMDASHHAEGEAWYIIDTDWLRRWKHFATTGALWKHPGPITNNRLLDVKNEPSTTNLSCLRSGLEARKDYRAVTKDAWNYLLGRYGGGPCIECHTLDIYAPNCTRIVNTWQASRFDCSFSVKDSQDWKRGNQPADGSASSPGGTFVNEEASPGPASRSEQRRGTGRSCRFEERPASGERTAENSDCGGSRSPSKERPSGRQSSKQMSRQGSKTSNATTTSKATHSKVADGVASFFGFRSSSSSPSATPKMRDRSQGSLGSRVKLPSFGRTVDV